MSLTGKTEEEVEHDFSNDGFWPAFKLSLFVEQYRPPSDYKIVLLKNEILTAVSLVNKKLCHFTSSVIDYEDINQERLDDELYDIDHHYSRAVSCLVMSNLVDVFATLNRREEASNLQSIATEQKVNWEEDHSRSIDFIVDRLKSHAPDSIDDGSTQLDNFAAVVL